MNSEIKIGDRVEGKGNTGEWYPGTFYRRCDPQGYYIKDEHGIHIYVSEVHKIDPEPSVPLSEVEKMVQEMLDDPYVVENEDGAWESIAPNHIRSIAKKYGIEL